MTTLERLDEFEYIGTYRVQSKARQRERASRLHGWWLSTQDHGLNQHSINGRLRNDTAWRGTSAVRLKAADVDLREGEFADEPDILYKRENFTPRPGSPALPSNVVDVRKAVQNWRKRDRYVRALLSFDSDGRATDLEPWVVADEYFAHEAGHCLGYDVDTKYVDGYFRPSGRVAWPLIYVEEFRADMLGLGLAAEMLDEKRASSVFLYNVLLRFGVHLEGLDRGGPAPYGSTPMLLYRGLTEVGVLGPSDDSLARLAAMSPSSHVEVMEELSALVRSELVASEMAASPIDVALACAVFHKDAVAKVQTEFDGFMARVMLNVPP